MRMILLVLVMVLAGCTKTIYLPADCPKPAALPAYIYTEIPPAESEGERIREMVIRFGECRERVKVLDAALDAYR